MFITIMEDMDVLKFKKSGTCTKEVGIWYVILGISYKPASSYLSNSAGDITPVSV